MSQFCQGYDLNKANEGGVIRGHTFTIVNAEEDKATQVSN